MIKIMFMYITQIFTLLLHIIHISTIKMFQNKIMLSNAYPTLLITKKN